MAADSNIKYHDGQPAGGCGGHLNLVIGDGFDFVGDGVNGRQIIDDTDAGLDIGFRYVHDMYHGNQFVFTGPKIKQLAKKLPDNY